MILCKECAELFKEGCYSPLCSSCTKEEEHPLDWIMKEKITRESLIAIVDYIRQQDGRAPWGDSE